MSGKSVLGATFQPGSPQRRREFAVGIERNAGHSGRVQPQAQTWKWLLPAREDSLPLLTSGI